MAGRSSFAGLRKKMVLEQLVARGISDGKVLAAMHSVPREKFIAKKYQNQAYENHPLDIGHGQTISQPYMVALMIQLLELRGREKVLEIGTGSGYQTAILSRLAIEVYSLERDPFLARRAKKRLDKLGFNNVKVFVRDGFEGLKEASPFEGIIVAAASETLPLNLVNQLAEGGRLVIPVGERMRQRLYRLRRLDERIQKEDFGEVVFVPLVSGTAENKK
ncbi:MAG: protein-L-isoaspartate(D-aspartate) O-methyltransferase [bacterium]|nr:protein-L-isoaspartate(D-aspartate) O-methyltransferase [bacterium]